MQKTVEESANLHLIPADEAQVLVNMRGRKLGYLDPDWDSELVFYDGSVLCYPELGVGKSPADPYEELVRLKVTEQYEPVGYRSSEAQEFDQCVADIELLTTLVMFTPPVEVDEEPFHPELAPGLMLPAGRQYSVVRIKPFTLLAERVVAQFRDERLVNQVDIGARLTMEDGTSFVLATNGSSYFLKVYLNHQDEERFREETLAFPPELRSG